MNLPIFEFDYSFLDLNSLGKQCISTDEMESIFYHPNTVYKDWHASNGIGYMIGYSLKNKFISLTFEFKNNQNTIRIIDVYLSYENEIKNNYFGL